MMGWLKRYRHTKGFGVHSPFAFRFITEVLEESLPYYDYALLPSEGERLLYRIACALQPRGVRCLGGADIRPVEMACPTVEVEGMPAEGQMVVAKDYDADQLCEAIDYHSAIILDTRRPDVLRHIEEYMSEKGYGMVFDNERDKTIIIARAKLPFQIFTLRL